MEGNHAGLLREMQGKKGTFGTKSQEKIPPYP
jgi:hypothetical protein